MINTQVLILLNINSMNIITIIFLENDKYLNFSYAFFDVEIIKKYPSTKNIKTLARKSI